MFRDGSIEGVLITALSRYHDGRGWLTEVFRNDELPTVFFPAMGYVSETRPGIARGPHEHEQQADLFIFQGPSTFRLYLWDNRQGSATYQVRQVLEAGAENPMSVIIPPGVVHAYKNVGKVPGWVLNFPNQLYRGAGRKEPIDEIRHEDDPATIYRLD